MTGEAACVRVELDESDMECLRHGSGVTKEFTDQSTGNTLSVYVTRENVDLDEGWLWRQVDRRNARSDGGSGVVRRLLSRLFP